jgi:ABC-type sugar transport system ATPase subunit
MNFLEVTDISVEEEGNVILQNISFSQQEFQKIAIAGETGSGKSTLLQTIAGLVQPSSGSIYIDSERVIGPHDVLVPGHAGVAYLSQQFELPQFLRVEQVLRYANTLTPETAETLYDICRITHLLSRKTNQLSGGERQRIALAKLLVTAPKLLLLDEPFSNLDMVHKAILKSVIQDIGEILEITCILISHDPSDTLPWADEIKIMRNGKIIQQGTPEQIYRQPVNEYAASLFGNYNLIPAEKAKDLGFGNVVNEIGKDLIIRPEQFRLATATDHAITGTVKNVSFFGSYYEAEIKVGSIEVKMRTPSIDKRKGEKVKIAFAPEVV